MSFSRARVYEKGRGIPKIEEGRGTRHKKRSGSHRSEAGPERMAVGPGLASPWSALPLGATNGEINSGAGIGAGATETDVKAATTVDAIVAVATREFIVATLAT